MTELERAVELARSFVATAPFISAKHSSLILIAEALIERETPVEIGLTSSLAGKCAACTSKGMLFRGQNYCGNCGQRIKWV